MYFESLHLWRFRNYASVSLKFSPYLNLIRGGNAQGKTNLLEALYFLCTGRSFRTQEIRDLIPYENPYFHLEGHFYKDGVSQVLKASFDGQVRKLHYNETVRSSFSFLLGLLPCVLLSPQDLVLVTGSPQERRRFLDLYLAQTDPLYTYHLGRFLKAVKQRNILLKTRREESLEMWEKTLAHSACFLTKKRQEAVLSLEPLAQKSLHALSSGEDHVEMHYHSTLDAPFSVEAILEKYKKMRKKELACAATLYGPHRDDLILLLNGKPAKNFSSEGQKRSLVTALRLAEWQELKKFTGYPPILGIDDFGIHLDTRRYHLVQKSLTGLGQVFLTTPTTSTLDLAIDSIIEIHEGKQCFS